MNIKECMEFINSYSKSGGRITDLSRAEELMNSIGNPEKRLNFVHIAGTNGKGSTLEYISNALINSGYRTGQFTSPFVLHYADRIRVNNSEIDNDSLCEICKFVSECVKNREYSQFEITMAIAFLWFEREKCDIAVIETGIGGLLDCTNVIPPPLLSVITSISLDHTAILGDTVEEIALQKAGIIKSNSAVVLSADNYKSSVTDIIENTAKEKNAEFIRPERSIEIFESDSNGNYFQYKQVPYRTAMLGEHQIYNAVTAIEACNYLNKKGFEITDENIYKSLSESRVNARVQLMDGNPPVIVDGGHNIDGVRCLIDTLSDIKEKYNYFYVVAGMIDSKDYKACTEIIAKYADAFLAVDGFATNSVQAEKLAEIANYFTESVVCNSLEEAVEQAKELAIENGGIVVVCGSLYLASEYLNSF